MTEPKTTNIPAPLYAAAGAGELAYRQLRKLPALYADLSGKATGNGVELRERAVATSTELRERAVEALRDANRQANEAVTKLRANDFDVERLREVALRNAAAFVAGAQAAQERAVAVYGQLVARGERVVGTGIVEAADTVNADIETTEKPAVTATPADVAAAKPAVKKTTAKKAVAKKATPAE